MATKRVGRVPAEQARIKRVPGLSGPLSPSNGKFRDHGFELGEVLRVELGLLHQAKVRAVDLAPRDGGDSALLDELRVGRQDRDLDELDVRPLLGQPEEHGLGLLAGPAPRGVVPDHHCRRAVLRPLLGRYQPVKVPDRDGGEEVRELGPLGGGFFGEPLDLLPVERVLRRGRVRQPRRAWRCPRARGGDVRR